MTRDTPPRSTVLDKFNETYARLREAGAAQRAARQSGPTDPPKREETSTISSESPDAYRKFLFSSSDVDRRRREQYQEEFANIHENSNKSCLAGSLNCNTDYIAPYLGVKPIREMLQEKDANLKKYKVPSRDIPRMGDYVQNNSIDAWEIHDVMKGEGLGTPMFRASSTTRYNDIGISEDIDLKTIPVGAILGQANSRGVYTQQNGSRHAITVVGYDDKDGMPLVYDYGKLRRLDEEGILPNNRDFPIREITVPNGYQNFTYDHFLRQRDQHTKSLGIDNEPISYNSEKPYIQAIERGVNEVKSEIVREYNVPEDTVDRLARFLPGIAMQESKLNNNEGQSGWGSIVDNVIGPSKAALVDNFVGNNILKPLVKLTKYTAEGISNFFEPEDGQDQAYKKFDYELEIEAYNKWGNNVEKRNEMIRELQEINNQLPLPKGRSSVNLDSSVGPFSIKTNTEFAENTLGISKGDMYGATVTNDRELTTGAKAALSLLAEKYKTLRKHNPNLTEDQLVDLTIVGYNNNSKVNDPRFIDHYIVNRNLPDDYLEKVKGFNSFKEGGAIKNNNMDPLTALQALPTILGTVNSLKGMLPQKQPIRPLESVNNRMYKTGGAIRGHNKYNAPSHEAGGQMVNDKGIPDPNGVNEIETNESKYTYTRIPKENPTYIFTPEDSKKVDKLTKKYKNSNKDSLEKNALELEINRIEESNEMRKAKKGNVQTNKFFDGGNPIAGLRSLAALGNMYAGLKMDRIGNPTVSPVKTYADRGKMFRPNSTTATGLQDRLSDKVGLTTAPRNPRVTKPLTSDLTLETVQSMYEPNSTEDFLQRKVNPDPSHNTTSDTNVNPLKVLDGLRSVALGANTLAAFGANDKTRPTHTNYNGVRSEMNKMKANYDPIREQAAQSSNQLRSMNKNSASSYNTYSNREAQRVGNLQQQLSQIGMSEQQMKNQISAQKMQMEGMMAQDRANETRRVDVANEQNQGAADGRRSQALGAIVSELDRKSTEINNRNFATATTKEQMKIIKTLFPNFAGDEHTYTLLRKLADGSITSSEEQELEESDAIKYKVSKSKGK